MNENIKKLVEKIKSPKLLIIVGLAGILLIGISSLWSSDGKAKTAPDTDGTITALDYRKELETDIMEIVEGITGSKNAKVVITLESGIKYSYADITEGVTADKTESNSRSTNSESKQSYITVKSADGGEQALLVTTEMPEIRGVAIVCEGGDNEQINEKIQNAVTAALNITSKRVYIAGGISNEKR